MDAVFEDDTPAAEALACDLRTPDPERRLASTAKAGREGGARCVPLLSGALGDSDARVRAAAAEALALLGERGEEHGDPPLEVLRRAAPALRTACADERAEVRRASLYALASCDDGASLPTFSAALRDENAGVRAEAVQSLARLASTSELAEAAGVAALSALGDDDHLVRYHALCAVDALEPAGFADALAGRLRDPRAEVAAEAAFLLAERGDRRATDGLVAALGHRELGFEAARLLGKLGDAAAVPALARSAGRLLGDPLVRLRAAASLAQLGDRSAEGLLLRALRSWRKPLRGFAIEVLSEQRMASAFDTILATAQRPGDYHCSTAARALGRYRDVRATAALRELLTGHPDRDVREDAAWALGELGDPAAEEVLAAAAVQDPDDGVRETARRPRRSA